MILSIDVSYRLGLMTLELPDGRILTRHSDRPREHLEFIQRALMELATESGLSWVDLTRLAVTLGPGSFTGLRVGLSAAKGLIFDTDIPLLPLPSLAVPALAAGDSSPRALFRRSRAGEFWTAFFPPGEQEPSEEAPRDLDGSLRWRDSLLSRWPDLLCIGDASDELDGLQLRSEPGAPEQLEALAELARRGGDELRGIDLDTLLPRYLAEPSVTPPGGGKS